MTKTMAAKKIYISSIQKRMFFLAFVTAFAAAFSQTLAAVIDEMIVCAFYGEQEIAAVSLTVPFFNLLEIPAAGLAAGIQAICARDIGAGKIRSANRKFNQIFFLSAAVSAIATLICFTCMNQLTYLFGARGTAADLHPLASSYLYGLSYEIIPYVLFCIMAPAVILDNGAKRVTVASILGCAADIILDLLSVHFGWGLFGFGFATSVSALVFFLITVTHFLKPDRVFRLSIGRIRFSEMKEVFVSSGPKAFFALADTIRSLIFISLATITGGVTSVFVQSIQSTVAYVLIMIANGIAGALSVATGICHGEKNGDDLEGFVLLAVRYIAVLSACSMAVLALCAGPLISVLCESEASASLMKFSFGCLFVTTPAALLLHVRISYLQALGKVKTSRNLAIATNLVVLSAAALILSLLFGVYGVFAAFPVSKFLILIYIWLIHSARTKKVKPSLSDFIEADESFFAEPGDIISYPLESKEDCALLSEQIMMFCHGHKLDERKGYLAGLCAEEMSARVFEQEMNSSDTPQNADIRVVIDEGDVIIRLRDSGSPFNLKQFEDRLEKEKDPETETGIRILIASAKQISYYRSFGMNTTIITI